MLLAIDAGNSSVDFALFAGQLQAGRWSLESSPDRSADDYARWLIQTVTESGSDVSSLTDAVMTSVIPHATDTLRTLSRQLCHRDPIVVGDPGVDLGIEVRAEQVGNDRLVNAAAGFAHFGGPLLVIDFGTATTFDVVGPDGGFEGGTIVTGANLMLRALHDKTAQLPDVRFEKPAHVMGKATAAAMQSGAYWGYVDLVEGMIARLRAETAWSLTTVATGGLAPVVIEDCPSIEHHNPDLTLQGLEIIHRRNRERER